MYTSSKHDTIKRGSDTQGFGVHLIEQHVVVVPTGVCHDGRLLGVEHGDASAGERLKLKRGDV